MQKNKNKKQAPPPNLLRGILLSSIGITLAILLITWLIINHQVEQLVAKRTSEYAHSIAKIAADSSAEPLLANDRPQLNLLTENIAKDPYIRQATIFSEDGQIVSQFPEELKPHSKQPDLKESEPSVQQRKIDSSDFIQRQKNIPFIEKISYQNVTAGWFKLEVDRYLLEKSFRDAFIQIQIITVSIALILFIILVLLIFKLENRIKRLAVSCQHLLVQHRIKVPQKKSQWVDAVVSLSEVHPQQLKSHISLPVKADTWVNSRLFENSLVCYLEFAPQTLDDNKTAENFTQAEHYLNQAIQAFGVQSQGDILTGCLIPFIGEITEQNKTNPLPVNKALCLIQLVRNLMSHLTIQVDVKACISLADILILEDEHDLITGISLADNRLNEIRKNLISVEYDEIISLSIEQKNLEQFSVLEQLINLNPKDSQNFRLVNISNEINQQIARKISYIVQDPC